MPRLFECGKCGELFFESEVYDDPGSDTGYLCEECMLCEHPEYLDDEW